jgi:hypothetical protein
MKGILIKLSSLDFVSVTECRIIKEVNDHGTAVISGIIDKKDEQHVTRMALCNSSEQILTMDDKEQVVFSGIIESVRVDVQGEIRLVTIRLTGGTKLLDVTERTRTFQNKSMTYEQLLSSVESKYEMACDYPGVNTGKEIGEIVVQYKETDWEFIKRLASHFNTCVFPNLMSKGSLFYFGLPSVSNAQELESVEYRLENNIEELRIKENNGLTNLILEDACIYKIKSRKAYELGNKIKFQEKDLYVAGVVIELENAELIYHYRLKQKNGFSEIKTYNKKLIGASLEGSILDVHQDKVKVHISSDESQETPSAKWFSYSTVFSSPDGTGWYCMPEKNDRVRLYFPSEKEEDGYIISSIHVSGGNARSNPDNKSLSTKYGKQMELTPTSITMTNNNGMMVKMDDEKGISIISDKDIFFESEGTISVMSVNENMTLSASESIELIQGNTKMTLKDDVTIEGAQLKMQ